MNFPHEAGSHFIIGKRKRLIILIHLSTSHHQKVGTLKREAVHGSSGSLDLSIPGNPVKSRRDVRTPASDDDNRKTPLRQAVRIATVTRGSEGEDGRETFLHECDVRLLSLLNSGTAWTVKVLQGWLTYVMPPSLHCARLWNCDKAHIFTQKQQADFSKMTQPHPFLVRVSVPAGSSQE